MSYWPKCCHQTLRPLKHVCWINPEVLSEKTDPGFEFDYIDIGNVTLEAGIVRRERMTFASSPSRARKPVQAGDIIVSTVRTYLKAVAFIPSSSKQWIVSTGFAVLRKRPDIDPRYIYRVIQSDPFVESVVAYSSGVSYPAINPSALGRLPVPVPDLKVQRDIADFLDRETARIDQLIEKKQQIMDLLSERNATLLETFVTKGLNSDVPLLDSGVDWVGLVPAHWNTKPLRALFGFRNEKNDPVKTEQILSLSIANGVTKYTEEGRGGNKRKDDLTAYKIAHKGDIVLNSMNVIVGAVGRSKYYGAISPVYYALYPLSEKTFVPYFEKIFLNAGFQRGLLRFGKGILMKISGTGKMNTIRMKISQNDLKSVVFPFPPEAEQRAIVAVLEERIEQSGKIEKLTARSIERLREFRSALITAAVTGQINVATWSKKGTTEARLDQIEADTAKEARA